MQQISIFWAE